MRFCVKFLSRTAGGAQGETFNSREGPVVWSRTHDGGLPAPAVQGTAVVAQAGEASEGEGAARGGHVQVVLVEQEGHPHPPLTLLPRVVERDGALPLAVLAPVLELERLGLGG